MSGHIDKDNPKRWFLVQDSGGGETSIKVFGYAGDQGVSELVTGQPNLNVFLIEDTLEAIVNSTADGVKKLKGYGNIVLYYSISGGGGPEYLPDGI